MESVGDSSDGGGVFLRPDQHEPKCACERGGIPYPVKGISYVYIGTLEMSGVQHASALATWNDSIAQNAHANWIGKIKEEATRLQHHRDLCSRAEGNGLPIPTYQHGLVDRESYDLVRTLARDVCVQNTCRYSQDPILKVLYKCRKDTDCVNATFWLHEGDRLHVNVFVVKQFMETRMVNAIAINHSYMMPGNNIMDILDPMKTLIFALVENGQLDMFHPGMLGPEEIMSRGESVTTILSASREMSGFSHRTFAPKFKTVFDMLECFNTTTLLRETSGVDTALGALVSNVEEYVGRQSGSDGAVNNNTANNGIDTAVDHLRQTRGSLLPHQLGTISWMIHRGQLTLQNEISFPLKTALDGFRFEYFPKSGMAMRSIPYKGTCGGILADEMGMGKTLEWTYSYLMRRAQVALSGAPWRAVVVCPCTVLSQWVIELRKWVGEDVNVLKYHGPSRTSKNLEDYDIIITSYDIIARDSKPTSARNPIQNHRLFSYYCSACGEALVDDNDSFNDDNDDSMYDEFRDPSPRSRPSTCRSCGAPTDPLFHEFVFDESHILNNTSTARFRACTALFHGYLWKGSPNENYELGPVVWAVTGTPMPKSGLEDYLSYWKLFNIFPFNKGTVWKRYLDRGGLHSGSDVIAREAMAFVCNATNRYERINRHTGNPTIQLPSMHIGTEMIDMPGSERQAYDRVTQIVMSGNSTLAQMGASASIHLGQLLNHIRMLCSGAGVCIHVVQQAVDRAAVIHQNHQARQEEVAERRRAREAQGGRSSAALTDPEFTDDTGFDHGGSCAICLEIPIEPAILIACKHEFCWECVRQALVMSGRKCPMCRSNVAVPGGIQRIRTVTEASSTPDNTITESQLSGTPQPPPDDDTDDAEVGGGAPRASDGGDSAPDGDVVRIDTKTQWVVRFVQRRLASVGGGEDDDEDDHGKVIIVSNYKETLIHLRNVLKAITGVVMLDGSQAEGARSRAITQFRENDQITILLMGIRAGSVGITLTEADTCILMEPHTSRAVVEQCLSRVHRIGQTRPVHIKRLVYRGTIEEKLQQYSDAAWGDNHQDGSSHGNLSQATRRATSSSPGLTAQQILDFYQ